MTTYYPVIGLEIHAEMNTQSKMFCRCKNDPFAASANAHICPICTGQPGALPYVNKQAIENVLRVGLAVGGTIADFTEFDRKNYFYPDMPKAYQISQYKYPLVAGGSLCGVGITRIHMEEDTATSSHQGTSSLVDFNRAGVPLMELVTEPVVDNADTAMTFAKELQLLLRKLGVGEANLEKGEMRIEANISLTTDPERKAENFNPAVEVKNLNSFRIVAQAIEYEIARQTELYNRGEVQVKETRGWDENKQQTFSQRIKETADDYRYFPDPDIPKFKLSEIPEFDLAKLKQELPELPWDTRERYTSRGLSSDVVEFFLHNPEFDALFVGATEHIEDRKVVQKIANYITSDLAGLHGDSEITGSLLNVVPSALARLIEMNESEELSSRGTKDVLAQLYAQGGDPRDIAEEQNLLQENDEESTRELVTKIVTAHPEQFEQFKSGEEKLLGFFVGQAMKESGGNANPQMVTKIIKDL